MKLQEVVKQRLEAIVEQRRRLVESWSPYINAVDAYLQKTEGRKTTELEKQNIAQCLENALVESGLRHRSKIFEAGETTSSDIAFLGVQLPVIAALLPSLVLNKIAIVQALDRRQGAVFYLDVQYGSDKGSLSEGGTLIGAKTGHANTLAARRYATELVYGETLGSAGATDYSGTLSYYPVKAGSVVITDGVETFTDDGNGNLVTDQSGGTDGTINYTTGAYSVSFKSATSTAPYANYQYYYERATGGVPKVKIHLTSSTIAAMDFPLRAEYTLGAAIDLEKAHGLVLENEVVKYLGGEIKFEIDHYGIEQIVDAAEGADAATSFGTWTATPSNGQEWIWKRYELIDRIIYGSNNIFAKTLRAVATFIIAGNNAARVIRQLDGHFKPIAGLQKLTPTGPVEIGELDGLTVIQDPFIDQNKLYLGYKGDNVLMAGFIYAPYIPLLATPTLLTADLKAQKGFLSAAGFKVINPGMYTYGQISGL